MPRPPEKNVQKLTLAIHVIVAWYSRTPGQTGGFCRRITTIRVFLFYSTSFCREEYCNIRGDDSEKPKIVRYSRVNL